MARYADRYGSASFSARDNQFCRIASGPAGVGLSLSGHVRLYIHFHVSGLDASGTSWTIVDYISMARERMSKL